ncbi:hypothetical protein [Phreatobacter sp.]|uniref:hypothetical protein n=1 Tax=Phreatobacter sp. TaxID=1966341 RepID=UPI003F6E52BB
MAEQETNQRLAERISQLAAQLASVQTEQRLTADRASEDRAEVKGAIAGVRAEVKGAIAEVRSDVADVSKNVAENTKTIQRAVDQIEGGRKALRFLVATGTVVTAIIAWATGLLKAIGGFLAR